MLHAAAQRLDRMSAGMVNYGTATARTGWEDCEDWEDKNSGRRVAILPTKFAAKEVLRAVAVILPIPTILPSCFSVSVSNVLLFVAHDGVMHR